MRGAPPATVSMLVLVLATACGSGSTTARVDPATGASSTVQSRTSSASRSTTVSVSFGSPVPATPAPSTAATAPPSPSQAVTHSARTAAPTAVPGPCGAADVGITTSTDRPAYHPGDTVQINVVVRNLSANGCVFSSPGDFTIDADSPPSPPPASWTPTVFTVHLGCPPAGCPPLAPGQMSTYPIGWNQAPNQPPGTAATQVPSGPYHARAAFPGYPVAATPFTIG